MVGLSVLGHIDFLKLSAFMLLKMIACSKILLFAVTVLLIGCSNKALGTQLDENPSVEQVAAVAFSCPHSERRDIFFSSSNTTDILEIMIVGNDCETARIIMQIITSNGDIIHSSEARALDYTYEDEGADGVKRMLEGLLTSESDAQALLRNNYIVNDGPGYYDVNLDALAAVKKKQAPLFCHRAGKSYSNCYVYLDGVSTFGFSSGS